MFNQKHPHDTARFYFAMTREEMDALNELLPFTEGVAFVVIKDVIEECKTQLDEERTTPC